MTAVKKNIIVKPEIGDINLVPLANKLNKRQKDLVNRIEGLNSAVEGLNSTLKIGLDKIQYQADQRREMEKRLSHLELNMPTSLGWRTPLLVLLTHLGVYTLPEAKIGSCKNEDNS